MSEPDLILIAMILIGVGVGYGIRSHEVGKKAAAQDLLYGILWIALFIVIVAGIALLRVPSRVNGISFIKLIGIGFALIFFIFYSRWKKGAGLILLDLGPSSQRKLLLIGAGLALMFGIMDLVDIFQPANKARIDIVFSCLFWLSYGVLLIFWGRSHFEIREGGILFLDRFIKWPQIKSYEWQGKDNHTLTLKLGKRFLLSRPRSLRVPAFHKEDTEKLLERYLSREVMGESGKLGSETCRDKNV